MAEEACIDSLGTLSSRFGSHALSGDIRMPAPAPTAWTYSLTAQKQPQWLDQAMAEIGELQRLKENWDSYGAPQIVPQILVAAAQLLRELALSRAPSPAVVPTVDGSLQVEWHTRGIDLELRWLSSTRIHVYFRDHRHRMQSMDNELQYDVTPLLGAIRELSSRAA